MLKHKYTFTFTVDIDGTPEDHRVLIDCIEYLSQDPYAVAEVIAEASDPALTFSYEAQSLTVN